jgi:hypothetical protein
MIKAVKRLLKSVLSIFLRRTNLIIGMISWLGFIPVDNG